MRRTGIALLVALALGTVPAAYATLPPDDGLLASAPPEITAKSWILYDDTFGQVLAEYAADVQRPMASTTKIMTALVVIEEARPDERVRITERAEQTGESQVGLIADEPPWTVEDLLAALLMSSANDAAVALAEHMGGSVGGFADLMNAKAAGLNLENTNFVNPHGLDHRDHYSSARDLLNLGLAAMDHPRFAGIVQALSTTLPTTRDGDARVALSTNKLLTDYAGAIGIKTGYTSRAILTMVAAAERDSRRIYAVVLGSNDHFGEVTALLDYGFSEFGPMTLVPATSDTRRPLARALYRGVGEDFELFIVEAPDETAITDDLVTVARLTAASDLEEVFDDLGPAPGEDEPVTMGMRRVEQRPELPGLRDALTWTVQYWNWILGNT